MIIADATCITLFKIQTSKRKICFAPTSRSPSLRQPVQVQGDAHRAVV